MAEGLVSSAPITFSSRFAVIRTEIYRFFLALRRYWWVPFLTISIGLAIAAWFISQAPPAYLSSSRMMVSGKILIREEANYTEDLVNFFGTQTQLMRSGEVQQRAQARVLALHPNLPVTPVDLEVAQLPTTSIFVLRATGASPSYTQAFLDAVMAEYIQIKREMRSQKSESAVTAITEELGRIDKELGESENDLLAFQKEHNVGFLEEQGNSAAKYLSSLNNELADLQKEYNLLENEDLDQNLDRKGQTDAAPAPASQSDAEAASQNVMKHFGAEADYYAAKRKLSLLQAQKQQALLTFRPEHPRIKEIEDEMASSQDLIDLFRKEAYAELKTQRESIGIRIKNLNQLIDTWQKKALELSGLIAEWEKIKAKKDRNQAQYDQLLTSLGNVDSSGKVTQDTVTILDNADNPRSVKLGMWRAIFLGLGVGSFLGLAIVIALDKINDQIKSFHDVQAGFKETILGHVPREAIKGTPLDLIRPDDPRHLFAEAFRTIRSSILYLPMDGARPKSLLITSAVPGEGKSTVSSNLAITLSFLGCKTLLVDADLRRGKLHSSFGVSGSVGFSEVLSQKVSWKEAIQPTMLDNLSLLPRGHNVSQPGEYFLSKTTDRFLQEVYREFEYIVFDSAPVIVADDTASLAPKIDAALFVVRFGVSSVRLTHRALQILYHRQVNLLGLVLNDLRTSAPDYEYYQYSKYMKEYTRAGGA